MALSERGGGGGGGGGVSAERWAKHYASFHRILLVGEGDFSFALSLALSFGSASKIVATSFDSYDVVINKYKRGSWNLKQLHMFGATLLFGVDATEMKYSASSLANSRFDRIVYNFPHAGFHGKEDDPTLIRKHRELVNGFFHNAAQMIKAEGEIHISHKLSVPFCNWNIEAIAFRNTLHLLQRVVFNIQDYPGYENKRGAGTRPDKPFPLGECCTFKFGYRYNHPMSDIISRSYIRFNICGVSMGEPGVAGCGGTMNDEEYRLRFMFWEPLGVKEFEVAEVCAFEAALCRVMRLRSIEKRYVVMGSRSCVAVNWINNPSSRPVGMMKQFVEIDAMLNRICGVRIEVISRRENEGAETLAREAIHSGESFETGYALY